LPEKYKTPEDFAKAHSELLTQFSQGKHKAPKDGKYDLKVFGPDVKPDDPAVKLFTGWAAKNGVGQAAFEEFAKDFVELGKSLGGETIDPQTYIRDEKAKLGQHAEALMKGAADWGRALIQKGVLSRDDWEEWKNMAGSADGVRIILKVREMFEGPLPVSIGSSGEGLPSKLELEAMVGDKRYQDPTHPEHAAYRAKVEGLFKQMYPG
jgi:hypothetical protein